MEEEGEKVLVATNRAVEHCSQKCRMITGGKGSRYQKVSVSSTSRKVPVTRPRKKKVKKSTQLKLHMLQVATFLERAFSEMKKKTKR